MKLLTSFITLFLVFNLTVLGQEKSFTFKGQVHANGESLKGALIEVYGGGDLIYEAVTKGGGKFQFELQPEGQYMVEISKEGLRMKTIWINTRHTQGLKFKVPTFSFDVFLKKEKITPYDELAEIPVTLIKYQPKKKVFYMDKTYENAIKNKKRSIKESGLQRR